MSREVIHTDSAPAAIGPYSQAIVVNGLVYTSGQTPLVPGTKSLVEGDIQAQTRQVLDNVKAILEAAGTSMAKVVKTTVYLQSMSDFAAMNEVYASYFGDKPPARTTVAVAGLPLGAHVEIEAIAVL